MALRSLARSRHSFMMSSAAPAFQRAAKKAQPKKKKKGEEVKKSKYLEGINDIFPELKATMDDIDTWPDEKFPDWLWTIDQKQTELTPQDGKKYWKKINKEKIKANNRRMKELF